MLVMRRKMVSAVTLTLLLTSMLTLAFNIQPVKSDWTWTETIYVRADGSIEPSTAPISTVDYVTYTLTDNILGNVPEYSSAIIIQRNNIVVDGAGYTVQGIGRGIGRGISLYGRSNVTIKNMEIKSFGCSIYLRDSSNTSISGNKITNNWCSIYLDSSSYNNIVGNNLTNNDDNIFLQSSQYNSISGNNITNNVYDGIDLWESSNNSIYHNNLINNTSQVITDSVNTWDKGYPSGGNYWSDYNGVDLYCGSYQNETGSDGIGDTPYVIDANNTDHYPLMNPTSAPIISGEVRILKPEDGFVAAGSVNITFNIFNMSDPVEFKKGDAHNRIDLEIEFIDKTFGVQVWSTSFDGLTLDSGQTLTKTVTYDATSQEVYGDAIIRIVHWKYNLVTEVYEFGEFGMHEIRGTLLPPLSVSISPLSASILVGQSVAFTSTVSGGYTPYGHQWYLNGNPVSGANLTSWTFTPTASGIYYICLKVTDAKGNTAQSDTARITVATVPVGGYSIPIQVHTKAEPVIPYIALIVILTIILAKRKTNRKH